jgi:hypothetical protein
VIVECEGVPRDLGRDQGVALGAAIRADMAGSALRRLVDRLGGQPDSRRWLRDVRRHFPHQGEWLDGLARAARVPPAALVRGMRASLRAGSSAVALAVAGADGVRIARSERDGSVLRRMRPEGRFASVEIGAPLLTSPWIGVNQGGLAVAAVGGAESPGSCAAPALLLVRDCLDRRRDRRGRAVRERPARLATGRRRAARGRQ